MLCRVGQLSQVTPKKYFLNRSRLFFTSFFITTLFFRPSTFLIKTSSVGCPQCNQPYQNKRRFHLSFIADDQSNTLKTISDELVESRNEAIKYKEALAEQKQKVAKLRANIKMVKEVHLYTKLIENSELIKRIGKRDYKIIIAGF